MSRVKVEGADRVLKLLRDMPKEFSDKAGRAVRSSVRAAAKLIEAEVVANLGAVIADPNVGGVDASTGLLRNSIKTTKRQVRTGESYVVRVSNKKYPKRPGAEDDEQEVSTPQVARLLEYGTEKSQPHPFIRPAFEAKKEEAVRLMISESEKKLQKIVDKAK
jgi:HK97 gp10 family phage protein